MTAHPAHRDDTGCPSADDLFAFAVGRLAADAREAIARHIETCAACLVNLDQLNGQNDPLQAMLRQPVPTVLFSRAGATPLPGLVETGPDEATGAGPSPAAPRVPAGEGWPVIPGYQILDELGHGGMGDVYRVFDADLQRRLAVKVLQAKHRGRTDLEDRFLEEAQLTGQLQHPGIAPVHQVGRLADGRPFFAMKLIQGRTLAALLHERRALTDGQTEWLAVFAQVCQAVAYAHSRGVLHRDLKPANVMVGAFGEVQVMDWGLAKVLRRRGDDRPPAAPPEPHPIATVRTQAAGWSTQTGSVLGTAAYMAPEQAWGEVDQLDERCDVFGLGGILCVLLTGAPPYAGPVAEVGTQARRAELTAVYARLDGCGADAELVALAKACLARERADRPRDAGAVAAAVAAHQAGVAERLRRAELQRSAAAVRAGEERKRRRLRRALGAAVLVVVLGAGAVGGWFAQERAQTREGVAALLDQAREHQEHYRWGEARAALTQAASRLGGRGSADLAERVRQAQAGLDLVARFDAIRLNRVTLVEGRFDDSRADRDYEDAFREAGLGEVHDDPEGVAARVRASAVRGALVAALDDWASCATDEDRRDWLLEVARRADPDAWRDRVRDPAVWRNRAALAELARTAPVAEQSVPLLVALGQRLRDAGGDATALLARVQRAHPADFWANHSLGFMLVKREPGEALGCYRAALAIRPETAAVYTNIGQALADQGRLDEAIEYSQQALQINPKVAQAHYNLGHILYAKGRLDEAIDHYQQALHLDPKDGQAHTNLGLALKAKGRLDEAIGHYQQALHLDPMLALAHFNLGLALYDKGRLDEAIDHYQQALDLEPMLALKAHTSLGNALYTKGRLDEAVGHYQQALHLDPKDALAHYNLGNALYAKGRLDEATDHYQQALHLDPKDVDAHNALGQALLAQGRFREARDATRRGLDLLPQGHPLRATVTRRLQRCERLLALVARLPAVLQGQDQPAAAERSEFADLCTIQKRYAAAARFYADAFAATPALADDLQTGHRYNAACVAALAGSGRGADAAQLDEQECSRLRQQALDWLRAELAAWTKKAQGPPSNRAAVRQALDHWRTDADLAGVREPDALGRLPDAERRAWQQLWGDVDRLRSLVGEVGR
jgi:serine/threonine-protein kinase